MNDDQSLEIPPLRPRFGLVALLLMTASPIAALIGVFVGSMTLTIVGIVFTSMWLVIATVAALAERMRHDRCHHRVTQAVEVMHRLHAFQMHEAVASELETLSDALHDLPQNGYVAVRQVAKRIDERARDLRASAPDPPKVSLDEDRDLVFQVSKE